MNYVYDAQKRRITVFEIIAVAEIERDLGRALTKEDTVEYGNAAAKVTLSKPLYARVASWYSPSLPPPEQTAEEKCLAEIESAALSEECKDFLRLALQTPDEPDDKGGFWEWIKSKATFWRQ